MILLSGGGRCDKAETTAKILLSEMNAMEEYLGAVTSGNTDEVPGKDDEIALENIRNLAKWLNQG